MILKNEPLNEMKDNIIAEFNLEESPPRRKRIPPLPKRSKRQLNMSGSSPYLEYLPDMLKKVEGYKDHKDQKELSRQRKVL